MAARVFKLLSDKGTKLRYIFPENEPDATYWALNALGSYYIMMNSMLPLSMVITLEIVKTWYTKFFEVDVEMIEIDKNDYSIQGWRV